MRNFQGEDLTDRECLTIIFDSLTNGQHRQAASQIKEYGFYDFVDDFREYLFESTGNYQVMFERYTDAILAYARLVERESHGS